MAGLFGSDDEWRDFEHRWCERTGNKTFHASECDSDRGDFARNPHSENKKLYKDLTQIICGSKLLGFGSAIDLAGHREFFPNVPDDVPYYRCFRDVVRKGGEWTELSIPRGTVKFTFDQRIESNHNAGVLYTHMRTLLEWSARAYLEEGINFESRQLVGIQAADLYAREVMKHLDNMIGPVRRPMRRSFEALRKTKRFGADFFMREHFQDFKRQFDEVSARVGFSAQQYCDWLNEHKIADTISARHRYLIEKDS